MQNIGLSIRQSISERWKLTRTVSRRKVGQCSAQDPADAEQKPKPDTALVRLSSEHEDAERL